MKKIFYLLSVLVVSIIFLLNTRDANALTPNQAIALENNFVKFDFTQTQNSFELNRITNKATGNYFTMSSDPLWIVGYYNPAYKANLTVNSFASATLSYILSNLADRNQLVLSWNNVVIASGEVISVSLTIDLPNSSLLADWRISVQNHFQSFLLVSASISWGVRENTADRGSVLIPYRGGHEIKNPATNIIGIENTQNLTFPTQGIAQLVPYYTQSGNGLYVATYDGGDYHKTFRFDGDTQRFLYTLTQPIPNTFATGLDFVLPYPLKIGVYQGGWFEAAQIYKQWATQQTWTNRGLLINRSDIPQWLKDSELINISAVGPSINAAPQLAAYNALKTFYDQSNLGIWWQGWTADPLYVIPAPGFANTVNQLKNNNVYSFV